VLFRSLPSVPAFLGGLFVYHPPYNIHTLADAAPLAPLLTLAAVAAALILSLRMFREGAADRLEGEFFSLLILSVIFTPLAADHHYILLAPAIWYLLFSGSLRPTRGRIVAGILIVYLLAGWFPSVDQTTQALLTYLYGYVRLYGAVILWLLMIIVSTDTLAGRAQSTADH
jgi:hypothetical protein